jgi:spoIIIJ-associated protein
LKGGGDVDGTLASEIKGFVETVTSAMGLDLEARVEMSEDGPRVDLEGDGGEVLVRRGGEALQALQHLATVAVRDQLQGRQRVQVDCLGFRRGKDAELRQMARFLSEKAKRTGIEQKLGPLNPYERRVVHLAVSEETGVASESIGDAFMKTVIISPRR